MGLISRVSSRTYRKKIMSFSPLRSSLQKLEKLKSKHSDPIDFNSQIRLTAKKIISSNNQSKLPTKKTTKNAKNNPTKTKKLAIIRPVNYRWHLGGRLKELKIRTLAR